jgi:hypothetical protein
LPMRFQFTSMREKSNIRSMRGGAGMPPMMADSGGGAARQPASTCATRGGTPRLESEAGWGTGMGAEGRGQSQVESSPIPSTSTLVGSPSASAVETHTVVNPMESTIRQLPVESEQSPARASIARAHPL